MSASSSPGIGRLHEAAIGSRMGRERAAEPISMPAGSSERPVRMLAAGVLVFLVYPALELAGGGLGVAAMTATVAATAGVVALYLWVVWHRTCPAHRLWAALAVMGVVSAVVPALWGPTWTGLLLFPAVASAIVLPPMAGGAVTAASAVLLAGEGIALGADRGMVLSLAVVVMLGGAGAIGYCRLAGTNASLRAARAEIARLAAAEERSRLGRDLHDVVRQELFVASMAIGTAAAELKPGTASAAAHLAAAGRAVRGAQESLAAVIGQARRPPEPCVDPAARLRADLAEWSARYGVPAEFDESGAGTVPGVVGEALAAAAHEALTNVARHARAHAVSLSMRSDPGGVEVHIMDDGLGFDPGRAGGGHGLAIMAERLDAVGGTAEIHRRPSGGTEVVLRWEARTEIPAQP
jgi:two-component system, NarL family, sensor histidine kinase DesK